MQIGKNSVVSIHYTLTNQAGQVVDTSDGRGPLTYLHGAGQLIPGLESALDGKAAGEKMKVVVAPAQGYGERDEGLVNVVPRTAFPGVPEIKVGMEFQARSDHGVQRVVITKIEGDQVTVDANLPLAGETLNFDVHVVDVRAASAEELEHGHVHGPGGHHHH